MNVDWPAVPGRITRPVRWIVPAPRAWWHCHAGERNRAPSSSAQSRSAHVPEAGQNTAAHQFAMDVVRAFLVITALTVLGGLSQYSRSNQHDFLLVVGRDAYASPIRKTELIEYHERGGRHWVGC